MGSFCINEEFLRRRAKELKEIGSAPSSEKSPGKAVTGECEESELGKSEDLETARTHAALERLVRYLSRRRGPEAELIQELIAGMSRYEFARIAAKHFTDLWLEQVADGVTAWRCSSCAWSAPTWRGPWFGPSIAKCPFCGDSATRRKRAEWNQPQK
jgi:rubrerythrin